MPYKYYVHTQAPFSSKRFVLKGKVHPKIETVTPMESCVKFRSPQNNSGPLLEICRQPLTTQDFKPNTFILNQNVWLLGSINI